MEAILTCCGATRVRIATTVSVQTGYRICFSSLCDWPTHAQILWPHPNGYQPRARWTPMPMPHLRNTNPLLLQSLGQQPVQDLQSSPTQQKYSMKAKPADFREKATRMCACTEDFGGRPRDTKRICSSFQKRIVCCTVRIDDVGCMSSTNHEGQLVSS